MVSFINTLKYRRYRNIKSFLSLFPTATENECVNGLGSFWKLKKMSSFFAAGLCSLCWVGCDQCPSSHFLNRPPQSPLLLGEKMSQNL